MKKKVGRPCKKTYDPTAVMEELILKDLKNAGKNMNQIQNILAYPALPSMLT